MIKRPVGILGWSDEERSEHERSGAWPWRAGLTVDAYPDAEWPDIAQTPGKPAAGLATGLGEAIRDFWLQMGERRARTAASAQAAKKRQAKTAAWKIPAESITRAVLEQNAETSATDIAHAISAKLKASGAGCPGLQTLRKFAAKIKAEWSPPGDDHGTLK
jgi:hypothetical protein